MSAPPQEGSSSDKHDVGCHEEADGADRSKESEPSLLRDEDIIPLARKLIFSAPTVATLPFVAMFGMHGNKSYQAFGGSLAIIALFTALARSFDVVSDPIMSYLTDSADFRKLPKWLRGRRKPFMFVGCFFYSFFLWLLLNPPYASATTLSLWFGCFYTLYFLANTFTTIPYDALAPELSENSKERTGLFFVSNLFDGVGTLVALGLPIIMTKLAADHSSRNDDICKTDDERASLCLASSSCGDFFADGSTAAYQHNATLAVLLSDIMGNIAAPMDPARRCITWLRTRAQRDLVLGHLSTAVQNDAFCHCMGGCGDACAVANKRTGFMLVGYIFAIWFVVTMVITVRCVPEREISEDRPKAPPIVPSMRSALDNKLFMILLPAWVCDAFVTAISVSLVPYFVEAVVAPAYQTMEDHGRDCFQSNPHFEGGRWTGAAGRPESPDYDPLCNTDNVIAVCGLAALVTAILVLPIWNLLVRRLGKVKTWFGWSLTMAATNLLFLFVFRSASLYFLFVVAALNGAPLGAKFLADAILADIIDYDEFLTGMRSEATYFMFKSFLPKIVQIPSSAMPIALLGAFDYKEPVGGRVQLQSDSVSIYIKCVVGIAFVCSVVAFFLKRRYPLRQEYVVELANALQMHKDGEWATDPISRRTYKPMGVVSVHEQEAFWQFNHFSMGRLHHAFLTVPARARLPTDSHKDRFRAGCHHLRRVMRLQLITTSVFLVCSIVASACSISLLSNRQWQFVPTLCVVCVGLGISSTAFSALRLRAARQLAKVAVKEGDELDLSVVRLLNHQRELAELGCPANNRDVDFANDMARGPPDASSNSVILVTRKNDPATVETKDAKVEPEVAISAAQLPGVPTGAGIIDPKTSQGP